MKKELNLDDFRIEIFHAMKARKTFLARLGLKEKQ